MNLFRTLSFLFLVTVSFSTVCHANELMIKNKNGSFIKFKHRFSEDGNVITVAVSEKAFGIFKTILAEIAAGMREHPGSGNTLMKKVMSKNLPIKQYDLLAEVISVIEQSTFANLIDVLYEVLIEKFKLPRLFGGLSQKKLFKRLPDETKLSINEKKLKMKGEKWLYRVTIF